MEFSQIILNLCKTTDLKVACLLNLVVGVVKCRILANTKRAKVFLLAITASISFFVTTDLARGSGTSSLIAVAFSFRFGEEDVL